MSGHSKWHNIQGRKNAQDAKRGKIFQKISRDLYMAAKSGGPKKWEFLGRGVGGEGMETFGIALEK